MAAPLKQWGALFIASLAVDGPIKRGNWKNKKFFFAAKNFYQLCERERRFKEMLIAGTAPSTVKIGNRAWGERIMHSAKVLLKLAEGELPEPAPE